MKKLKLQLGMLFLLTLIFSSVSAFKSKSVMEDTRQLASFNKIIASGGFDIVLNQASTQSIRLTGSDEDIKTVSTVVEDGALIIKSLKHSYKSNKVTIYIDAVSLNSIVASGAIDIKSTSLFKSEKFEITSSGASEIKMNIETKLLVSKLSGASEVELSGKVDTHAAELSGASELSAYELVAEKYALKLSGASESEINVSTELNATGSGASEINYKGNPTQKSLKLTGSSSVRKAN